MNNNPIKNSACDHVPFQAPKTSSDRGLQRGWTRVTFIIKDDHCKKIKQLSKINKISIKKLLSLILSPYLASKKIPPLPESREKSL